MSVLTCTDLKEMCQKPDSEIWYITDSAGPVDIKPLLIQLIEELEMFRSEERLATLYLA